MLDGITVIAVLAAHSMCARLKESLQNDERGEGVISAAIAVLIMAFLGAAMWVVFRQILEDSGSRTDSQLRDIGGAG